MILGSRQPFGWGAVPANLTKLTVAPTALRNMQTFATEFAQDQNPYVRVGPFVFPALSDNVVNAYSDASQFNPAGLKWLSNILLTTYDANSDGTTAAAQPNRGTFWNAGGSAPINPPGVPTVGANARNTAQLWPQDYLDQYRAWMTALGVGSRDYYLPYLSTMHGVGYGLTSIDGTKNFDASGRCFVDFNRLKQIWFGTPIGTLRNPATNKNFVLSIGLGAADDTYWDPYQKCWFDSCAHATTGHGCKPVGSPTPQMKLYAWWIAAETQDKSWWDSIKADLVDLASDACWLVDQKWTQLAIKAAATAESGPGGAATATAATAAAVAACAAAFPPPDNTPVPSQPTTSSDGGLVSTGFRFQGTSISPQAAQQLAAGAKPFGFKYSSTCVTRFNETHKTWSVYCPPGTVARQMFADPFGASALVTQAQQSTFLTKPPTTAPKLPTTSTSSTPPAAPTPGSSTPSTTCPAGYQNDPTTGQCVLICAAGATYDPTSQSCIAAPTPATVADPIYKKPVFWASVAGGVAAIGGVVWWRSAHAASKAVAGRRRRRPSR